MRRSARLIIAVVLIAGLIAGGARAGETACWFENGAVVVPAAFGDIAGDFILDLSAPRSQLHLTRAHAEGIVDATARRDLAVAGERIADFPIEVADLDARSQGFAASINGILGDDALAPFVIDIAFAPCQVTLYRRPPPRAANSVRLRVRRVAGIPTVVAAISDGVTSRRGHFAIDSASVGLRVADASLSRPPPTGVDPTERTASPARLRALSLGGLLFEQTPAGLMAEAPGGLDGAIGNAVWSRTGLRLDLKRGRLDLGRAP